MLWTDLDEFFYIDSIWDLILYPTFMLMLFDVVHVPYPKSHCVLIILRQLFILNIKQKNEHISATILMETIEF